MTMPTDKQIEAVKAELKRQGVRLVKDIAAAPNVYLISGSAIDLLQLVTAMREVTGEDAGLIERLREALREVESRVDYAMGMYHDATRWASEDGPDGGTLRDYVFAPARQVLTTKTGNPT